MTNNPTIDGVRKLAEQACGTATDSPAYKRFIEAMNPTLLLDLTAAHVVDPTSDLREHCKQCAEVVKTWPEWKQNCLGGAPVVERQPAKPYPDRLCHTDYTAHPYRCGCLKGDEEAQRRFDEHQAAALQSTIAQLQARVQELEIGRSESVAYLRNEGVPNNLVVCGFDHPDAFKVFRVPPAPVAVVLPDKSALQDLAEKRYGYQTSQLCMLNGSELDWVWQACLDATAALNGERK